MGAGVDGIRLRDPRCWELKRHETIVTPGHPRIASEASPWPLEAMTLAAGATVAVSPSCTASVPAASRRSGPTFDGPGRSSPASRSTRPPNWRWPAADRGRSSVAQAAPSPKWRRGGLVSPNARVRYRAPQRRSM